MQKQSVLFKDNKVEHVKLNVLVLVLVARVVLIAVTLIVQVVRHKLHVRFLRVTVSYIDLPQFFRLYAHHLLVRAIHEDLFLLHFYYIVVGNLAVIQIFLVICAINGLLQLNFDPIINLLLLDRFFELWSEDIQELPPFIILKIMYTDRLSLKLILSQIFEAFIAFLIWLD